MTWVEYIPAATGVAYFVTSLGYAAQGNRGMALAYFAYALANVGLIWAAVEMRKP